MSNSASSQSQFEPVSNPTEIFRFLTEGAHRQAPALCWTKSQENMTQAQILELDLADKAIQIKSFKEGEFKRLRDLVAQAEGSTCFFSFSLPRAYIFFKGQLKEYFTDRISFAIPDRLFKVQRRQSFRHRIVDTNPLTVTFTEPRSKAITQKNVFDISENGLSFIISVADQASFKPKDLLSNLKLIIKEQTLQTVGEIKHVTPLNQQPLESNLSIAQLKVGVALQSLSESEKNLIASFVLDQSRKYFSRFVES